MKFKRNQLVYFYEQTGEYSGTIVSGVITSIVQDLEKGKTFYNVKVTKTFYDWDAWYLDRSYTLEKDQLYTSYKQIQKEYKEEIVYNTLYRKLNNIETILQSVFNEVKQPVEVPDFKTLTISGDKAFSTLYVNAEDIKLGNTSIKEEIENIKKEMASIKKQIKQKTKKPVVKEKEKEAQKIVGTK